MSPSSLWYLLVCAVFHSAALCLPQGATFSELPIVNLTGQDPRLELDELASWNQSISGLATIPRAFDLDISQGPLKINGKSTYMNVLKAMVTLSEKDFLASYAGNTFSFEGYTDMRIQIIRTNSRSASLQHRFAIYGLYSGIYHLSRQSKFRETLMTLYWSGSGSKTTVGYIKFTPWPMPSIRESNQTLALSGPDQASEGLFQSSELANLTLISEDAPLNAPQLTISPIFGGFTLVREQFAVFRSL